MTRSRRKQSGRQKALDGWTTHPTGREESALHDFIQETDFEEYLQKCKIDDWYWYEEPRHQCEARAGVYFNESIATVDLEYLEFVSNGTDLGDQRSTVPAELRPDADDLQHLERLETESYEVTVRPVPTC